VLKILFHKRRLFVLQTSAARLQSGELQFSVLYLPRVKEYLEGSMFNPGYFKELLDGYTENLDLFDTETINEIVDYFEEHKDEHFAHPAFASQYREPQINRWLTKRMRVSSNSRALGYYFQPWRHQNKTKRALCLLSGAKIRRRKSLTRRIKWRIDNREHRQLEDEKLSLMFSKIFQQRISVKTRNV
jgi:hypothetical protein